MPSIDPITGEIIPDEMTPLPGNPNQLPPLPPQLPPYPTPVMPPKPLNPQQRIAQMGGNQAFGNALAAFGSAFGGGPNPTEQLQKQYQSELGPWEVQARAAVEQAGQQYGMQGKFALEDLDQKFKMRVTQLEQQGLDTRQAKELASAEKRHAETVRVEEGRTSAMTAANEKDNLYRMFTSTDPSVRLQGWNLAAKSSDQQLRTAAQDPQARKMVEETARIFQENHISMAKAETAKNNAEAKWLDIKLQAATKANAGAPLSSFEKFALGMQTPMNALDTLKFSEMSKMLNSKDPATRAASQEMFLASLTGQNPEMFLLHKFAMENGGDYKTAFQQFSKLNKDKFADKLTLLKVLSDPMATATASPQQKSLIGAFLTQTLNEIAKDMGIPVPQTGDAVEQKRKQLKDLVETIMKSAD